MAVEFSGSLNLTGSLQTTGSILLIGNETITGSLFVSNNIWSNGYKVIESSQTSSMAVQFSTDLYIEAKNTTGTQINKGKIVRIIGATGDSALIGTASWDNDLTSAETIGWTYENIANDAFGKIILYGKLIGVNTDGMVAGDVLYLSSSGNWTNIKPHAPNHMVIVGQVLRVQQNNGSVAVKIQNGYELDELHNLDINTSSLANNQLLAYSGSVWRNETIDGLGIATTQSLNSHTASVNNINAGLMTYTSSLKSAAIVSSSTQIQNYNLFALTASANTFYGNQTITGSLSVSGSLVAKLNFVQGILNANQSIPTTSDTLIDFVDQFDPNGWWNPTAHSFNPNIAGYYNVSVGVRFQSMNAASGQYNVKARKNTDVIMMVEQANNNSAGSVTIFGSKVVYLDGNLDYVDFTAYQETGTNKTIYKGTTDGSETWFTITLLGS